ncbi:hypothetical protein EON63_21815 [archaeon]|nr:MAG: hypothetical protein EON63_21815 [archaeon]
MSASLAIHSHTPLAPAPIHTTSLSSDPHDTHSFSVLCRPGRDKGTKCLQYWQLSLGHYQERADVQSKVNIFNAQYDHDLGEDNQDDNGVNDELQIAESKTAIHDLDKDLQTLYTSLPDNSVMLVVTQDSLVQLRKLIASKTRNKWQVQQAARGQKICLPIDAVCKDRKLGK